MSLMDMGDTDYENLFGFRERSSILPSKGGVVMTSYKQCDHAGEPVFYLGESADTGVVFRAANYSGAREAAAYADVFLDLAGVAPSTRFVEGDKAFVDVLSEYSPKSRVVRLNWADMSAPPVGYVFWVKLLEILEPGTSVVVACHGSHGRTGTALAAILLAYSDVYSAEEAVTFIRKNHCHKAVESKSQTEYLQKLVAERAKLGTIERKFGWLRP